MPFPEFLSARKKVREAQQAKVSQQAQQAANAKQEMLQKARLMEDLLRDTRYGEYALILNDARDAFLEQLRTFEGVTDGSDFQSIVTLGRLQGRLDVLTSLVTMPQTFLELAATAKSAQNGHAPVPDTAP